MSEQAPVDAGAPAPTSEPTPTSSPNEVEFLRSEAHRAFEKRDAAKARVKELEAQLSQLTSKTADAGDDVTKQLAAVMAERDELRTKVATSQAERRQEKILGALTKGAPPESHKAIELLYKSQAAALDDGEAEPDAIAKDADAVLRQIAPQLFETATAPKVGRIPNEDGSSEMTPEQRKAKEVAEFRKKFPHTTGIGL